MGGSGSGTRCQYLEDQSGNLFKSHTGPGLERSCGDLRGRERESCLLGLFIFHCTKIGASVAAFYTDGGTWLCLRGVRNAVSLLRSWGQCEPNPGPARVHMWSLKQAL